MSNDYTIAFEVNDEYNNDSLGDVGTSEESKKYIPLTIKRVLKKKLNASLCVSSHINEYSLCIEYAKKWFLDKFPDNFFKSIYIDGEHALSEFRKYNTEQFLKREKPSLSILPQEDMSFDSENLDLGVTKLDMFIYKSRAVTPFFRDQKKELFLKILMKLLLVNFTFKVRVNTKAKQYDIQKYMRYAFGAGTTQGHYMDMDYHVPSSLMLQLAKDAGFTVRNDKIIDIVEFLTYLNTNSMAPFLYKLRCSTGNNEFFLRIPNLYVHHKIQEDIQIDDGERQGHISSNYNAEMSVAIRFPCPMFYAYYTAHEQDVISFADSDGNIVSYVSNFNIMPVENSKGWKQYMTTEIEEEVLDKYLIIDFGSLFTVDEKENSDLIRVINHTMALKIDPSIFIEIKVFNARKEQSYTMDWSTMKMTLKSLLTDIKSCISIYIDSNYFNEQLININEYNKSRISYSNKQMK